MLACHRSSLSICINQPYTDQVETLDAHNGNKYSCIACTCCNTCTLQEVQRDNLALYKKLRFMTAYSKGQQQQQQPHSRQPRNNSGSSSSGAAGGMLSDRDAAATAAAEARYADLYERELDPFRAFAQSEAEVSALSVTTTAASTTTSTTSSTTFMVLAATCTWQQALSGLRLRQRR
jgi:cobalamin biosynthesis Mg chelatase CobN